ncbi:MAG: thymidylate synthase [Beijerinckiaceae bacterium]
MEIIGEGLDDVLIDLYDQLLKTTSRNKGTRGGTLEILGVTLRISKPRARLSRSENRGKPFSALGELLWYLAGSNKLEFIEPYVSQYKKDAVNGIIHGAYGPRLFAMRDSVNQIENVTALLKKRPSSRRAVIQLFNAEDIASEHKEIPCTTTLQFHLRDNTLHLSTTLRSNDAYWGLPHDIFCFTMLQEMMARRLQAELGEYYQFVGSMHVYEKFLEPMRQYITEGHQRTVEMPPMPQRDPFELVGILLKTESRLRAGEEIVANEIIPDEYWADIIRLLQVFWASGENERLDALKGEFANPIYRSYLEARRNRKSRIGRKPNQGLD